MKLWSFVELLLLYCSYICFDLEGSKRKFYFFKQADEMKFEMMIKNQQKKI